MYVFLLPPQGTFFNDLLLSVFCELCALVQEAQVSYLCTPYILINAHRVHNCMHDMFFTEGVINSIG